MERLLNLLQEFYGEDRKFINENGLLTMTNGVVNLSGAYAQTYIISIQGGFIKWLLNNQKIDQEKLDHSLDSCSYIKNDLAGSCIKLTMFLSIKDNPIEFLVSILK